MKLKTAIVVQNIRYQAKRLKLLNALLMKLMKILSKNSSVKFGLILIDMTKVKVALTLL